MGKIATVVIDMLNPYDHEDSEQLAENVRGCIEPLRALIDRTAAADGELIYVNDNYDDFTATSQDIARNAVEGRHPELVEPVLPPEGALFVQKVRHSAFYSTSLDYLLRQREIETVVLAGQVTEQCVLYSALDAYVRHFEVRIPSDAVAPIDPDLGKAALLMMERNMRAHVRPAAEVLD